MSNDKYIVDQLAVAFEIRVIEDRDETERHGAVRFKEQHICLIYLPGGNDKREHICDDSFFARRHPDYRNAYEAWLKQEAPVITDGTPIDEAPFVTKAQAAACKANNVLSVEMLAEASDPTLERMGMGFRSLQNKAKNFVKAADTKGKVTEQLTAKDLRIERLEAEVVEKVRIISELEGRIRGLEASMAQYAQPAFAQPQMVPQQPPQPPQRPEPRQRVDTIGTADAGDMQASQSAIEEAINRNKNKPKKAS